jgi:hypothetical protein
VTEEEVNQALCKQFGVTFVDLDRLVLDNSLALVINREYAERHRVIPISKTDRVLVIAMDVSSVGESSTSGSWRSRRSTRPMPRPGTRWRVFAPSTRS